MDDQKHKYVIKELEIIQDIIKRMASNSFLIKGWTVTLVVVTLLLKGSKYQVFISFIPLLSFWIMDSYFIMQERMYRKLYEWVVANRPSTQDLLFDMNARRFKDEVSPWPKTIYSLPILAFYLPLLILISAYIICLFLDFCK
ncbi:MAG: hypothetical protein E3J72_14250 [Planctomycetota bacterium]|nr:MAG: hypothetical protein E3J72_14250 [Planctomycetota bacterium]